MVLVQDPDWPVHAKQLSLVPPAKVAVWAACGAPPDMLLDLQYGIWVPTTCFVPANFRGNYVSVEENHSAVIYKLDLLEQEGKIKPVQSTSWRTLFLVCLEPSLRRTPIGYG